MQLVKHPTLKNTMYVMDGERYCGMAYMCSGCSEYFCVWDDRYYSNDGTCYYCGVCTRKRRLGRVAAAQPVRERIEIDVPARYTTASILDLKPQEQAKLKRWPYTTPLLAVKGNPGSGKTHICWAVAKDLANRGIRVRIQSAADLRAEWIYRMKNGNAHEWERSVYECPYLVLDDISAPSATDGWVEFFHQLLDKRSAANRPTLLTTAADGQQIEGKYSKPIRSRLNFWTWLTLPAVDRREASKEEVKPDSKYSMAD